MATKTIKTKHEIPKYKVKLVKELLDLLKTKKTILLASVSNLPGSQYQQIVKKVRNKAVVKVPKKTLLEIAIDETKNEDLKELKNHFKGGTAILFSDADCFDLASDLLKSKSPAKAKVGQEAPEDILIQAGPTDLPPGPAISELGAVGLKVEIKEGKIHIKEPKVIVKKGQAISQGACDIMSKLNIFPFSIGFIPESGYDLENKVLYTEIVINTEETLNELKQAFSKSLAFGVSIGYPSKETIKFMLSKAAIQEKAIQKLLDTPLENKSEEVEKALSEELTGEN
jgi:large subunit ribosomal protein L10